MTKELDKDTLIQKLEDKYGELGEDFGLVATKYKGDTHYFCFLPPNMARVKIYKDNLSKEIGKMSLAKKGEVANPQLFEVNKKFVETCLDLDNGVTADYAKWKELIDVRPSLVEKALEVIETLQEGSAVIVKKD